MLDRSKIIFRSLLILAFFVSVMTQAHSKSLINNLITEVFVNQNEVKQDSTNGINQLVDLYIKENHRFFGLAFYYNDLKFFKVNSLGKQRVDIGQSLKLNKDEWFVIVGRFNVLAIKSSEAHINLDGADIKVEFTENEKQSTRQFISPKYLIGTLAPELEQLRYEQLIYPLAVISKFIEKIIIFINNSITNSWGLTLIIFTILFKLVLLPVGLMTAKFQKQVSKNQAILEPQFAEIKANFEGEEAHNKTMAAYKALGISPFYTLKPMLGMLIQIPLLIGAFNTLGEMPQLAAESFLWIKDLSLPDTIAQLPFSIPFLGDQFNLLPFLMTAVTIIATILFKDTHASKIVLKSKRRNLYIMAAVFFILFYPFPAAMVLFWTLNSLFQTIQQQLF